MKNNFLYLLIIVFIPLLAIGQQQQKTVELKWQGMYSETTIGEKQINYLSFDNAVNNYTFGSLPLYQTDISVNENDSAEVELIALETDTLSSDTLALLFDGDLIGNKFLTKITYLKNIIRINVLPLKNQGGMLLRLKKFKLLISLHKLPFKQRKITFIPYYANNSVLSSGVWHRLGITKTGVYRLDYNDFENMGLNPKQINPKNIRIYGNYNGILPEANSISRPNNLMENAISVEAGSDGHFDQGDYVLFYARGPMTWRYNPFTGRYDHQINIYTDTTWYFLTVSDKPGKRIATEESLNVTPKYIVTKNYDYQVHEKDLENLIASGKQWYGERLNGDTMERVFNFSFPDLRKDKAVYLHFDMVARSFKNTYYKLWVNNQLVIDSSRIYRILSATGMFARDSDRTLAFFADSSKLKVRVKYFSEDAVATAWINYIELNVVRDLSFTGTQMTFADPRVSAKGNVSRFVMSRANSALRIWDVSNIYNTTEIAYSLNGSELSFTVPTDLVRKFIAFDGSEYFHPVSFKAVANQNLHSIAHADMIIIAPKVFSNQAKRLAQFHINQDGLQCIVVEPQQIYNEFSSGSQDVSAIRDFIKMLYDKNVFDGKPGYLLLFGDGSFDYRNRLPDNTNFVPTYESKESLRETGSYVTDDFFGLLDENEGASAIGNLDIGIGRFPVSTPDEAKSAVDKVEHYMSHSDTVMRNWRNRICFVADDQDNNLHLKQAEKLSNIVDTDYPFININKIYSDAFTKVKIPEGYRYPEVNKRINQQMGKGVLIMNYTGHGGLIGWSDELILDLSAINAFDNFNNLPLFITATCEFSRFDDPNFVSAGEYTFLNKHGGAIGLLTTTRLAYANANIVLNKRIYKHLITRENGSPSRLGDLIRLAKIPSNDNFLNFVLLGDPALRLAIPYNNVVTTEINAQPVGQKTDTVHALSKVTVKGEIRNEKGLKIDDFNGFVYPKIFDKPTRYSTRGNDGNSYPQAFYVQDKVLFSGKVSVVKGKFSFSFVVPKDISYRYGFGKISYYAFDTVHMTDAKGFYRNLFIGGMNDGFIPDSQGPDIALYFNNRHFVSGGITSSNPELIADVSDEQGINATGLGLGRDITVWLDNDKSTQQTINIYFKMDVDSYQKGTIAYPLKNISEGMHTLTLKVWDIQNNSSEKTIAFDVVKRGELLLWDVKNYPNPFSSTTFFNFKHNRPGQVLDVNINIYSIQGRFVCNIHRKLTGNRDEITPILWDGRDVNGNEIKQGVYLYTVSVFDSQGNIVVRRQKFIKINQ